MSEQPTQSAVLIPDMAQLHPQGFSDEFYHRMEQDLTSYLLSDGTPDPAKTEAVDCSLCGAPPPRHVLFTKFGFPYVRCPGCGLVYPSPRPAPQYIEAMYRTGRFVYAFTHLYLPSAEYRMQTIFLERVRDLIRPRQPAGKLLDVGCGSGHFLKVAHQQGYEVYGIEPNPEMVALARDELGLPNIREAVLESGSYPPETFDVVTMWDVLEHVIDPHGLLQSVDTILRPGGWVFAYTENVESFNVDVSREWSEIFAADVHLRHYSPATFRRQFETAGFMIDRVYTMGLDVAHIIEAIRCVPEQFGGIDPDTLKILEQPLQRVINESGRGDNLRLIAYKGR